MIRRTFPCRDAVFAQKSPNFRFRGTLHPRATVRRDAAGFTDEQRIIVRRQGLHFTAFLQTRQQLVLLKRPAGGQFALADQGKQRHQQRVLRLTVIQRTQHAAED